MKTQNAFHFNPQSFIYLLLLAITLTFSAFSCEVCDPLEIKIENRTGYDLKDIEIDEVKIASLKKGQTSSYVSTTEFEYLKSLSAIVEGKFERKLRSEEFQNWDWCGTGREYANDYAPQRDTNILQSGKHTFVLTSIKDAYQTEGYEILVFSKK